MAATRPARASPELRGLNSARATDGNYTKRWDTARRNEMSPFVGMKDSGNGVKEGVIEGMKFLTNVKTYSLPWPH